MTDHPMLFSAPMVRALLAGTKTQTRRVLKPQPSVYAGNPTPPAGQSWTSKRRDEPYFAMHDDQVHWCWWDEWNRQGPDWIKVRVAKGDRIWVRETWAPAMSDNGPVICYRANFDRWYPEFTGPDEGVGPSFDYDRYPADYSRWAGDLEDANKGWTPGIHMFRWASRLTLTVADVRVQRLQQCNFQDALAEGVIEFFRGPDRLNLPAASTADVIAAASEMGIDGPVAMYRDLWESINGAGSWDANPWVAAYTFTVARGNIDQLARAA